MARPTQTLIVALGLLAACRGAAPSGSIDLRVPPGASVRQVGDSLAAHGLIASRPLFRLRARLSGVDRSLKPGIYRIPPGTGVGDILTLLSSGQAVALRLTLPEGATLFDLARQAESRLQIPVDSMLAAARDTSLLQQYGITGPSVEGWLLPETFDFGGFSDADAIIRRFLTGRQQRWDSTWNARAASIGLDRHGLLTLASIVQAEARHAEELPLIAAVYRNRLRIGMPLQADPTIQYGYLVRDGARKSRLFYRDYALDSPWNTYRYAGLPPGPIGNPGREAIEATLSPAPVAYLYFVARADGYHQFSRTYQQHQRAVSAARAARPADTGSPLPAGQNPPGSH